MSRENINKDNVEKVVKEVISDRFNVSFEKIKAGSLLKDDLGLDSFGAVELAFELKDKFGVEIPQEEFNKIQTVEDIVEYIANNLSKR
jgi:acyl carrier protein